jgi:hypothetical protein
VARADVCFFDFFALHVEFGLESGDVLDFGSVGDLHALEESRGIEEELVVGVWSEVVGLAVGE